MTGIEKLVESIDRYKKDRGSYPSAIDIEEEARRLADEEKAQRATASLVEELKDWFVDWGVASDVEWSKRFNEILSRLRPAPSRTAELVKRVRAHINEAVVGGDMPPWMAQDINKILADFEKEGI